MKLGHYLIYLVSLIGIGSLTSKAKAQDTVINVTYHGKLDSIHSSILNQERFIQVLLPPGYKTGSTEKYDVLYVLDGSDYNTNLIAQLERFVETADFMPPTIIVSILSTDRNPDLTPTHLETWKNSGNAEKFLGFIKNELIPHINNNYPSNGDNTLWGHSLSGMFVLYTLVNEPTLFKSYIASDPSVWWDNCLVIKMAAAKLPNLPLQNTTFFIAGRDNDISSMKIDTLETVLKNKAPAGLKWKLKVYKGETHYSVRLKSTYDGLKFTYEGHIKNMYFSPMHGIVLKDKPFKLFYDGDTARMHFTVDGTTPTVNSPRVLPEITVNGPAKVTYKVLTNRSRYDRVTTGLFTDEQMPKPLSSLPKKWQPGGFNYAYYEGSWAQFPDITKLKPAKTGITDSSFDVVKLPRKNHYALTIDGFLESKEDGYYLFGLAGGEKGTRLYIDNKLVIEFTRDDDDVGQTCIVPLTKGFYPFRIEFNHQHDHNSWNELDWQQVLTPSIMESQNTILIPVSQEYGLR